MDLSSLVNFIKQKLLEGWVLTCCVKDCVEPLKLYADVIYIDKDIGLALVKKTRRLKEFLEVDDEEFEKLRVILYNPHFTIATGLCYTENYVGEIDEAGAEGLARYVLELSALERNMRYLA